jgi:hypothetical protein
MQAPGTAASLQEKLTTRVQGKDPDLSGHLCISCWNNDTAPLPAPVHKPDLPEIQSNTLATPAELKERIAEEKAARKEARQTKQEKVRRAQHLTKLHHHPTGRLWTRAESSNKRTRREALAELVQQRAPASPQRTKLTDQQAAKLTVDL